MTMNAQARGNVMVVQQALAAQGRVIYALVLRDVRTRFFGNGLGFVAMSVGWPLVHIIGLLTAYTLLGRTAPVGDSLLLFFSTGLMPFMTYSYLSRWMMSGFVMNKPLLAFPIVSVTDIVLARALLETIGSILMAVVLCAILASLGVDFVPRDIPQACYAWGAAILFGIGMGTINSIFAMAFHGWLIGYALVIVVLYVSSGILFVVDTVPEPYRTWLAFNPVLHAVSWMRSAYYPGYGAITLDKSYLLGWALYSIFAGFLLERLIRGRLLQG
jgi:capsular polysaccharide transport system permease protein